MHHEETLRDQGMDPDAPGACISMQYPSCRPLSDALKAVPLTSMRKFATRSRRLWMHMNRD
jgi:hypothetical protein